MSGLVTAVVAAAFDPATDAAVLAVRDRVAAAGVRMPARPRHRPHLTMAAVRVHPDQLDRVTDLVREVAAAATEVPCTLDRVGTFGRAGALWLGPADTHGVCTLQRSVFEAVTRSPWPSAFAGRSEPGTWVPHCSLATRLDRATLERVHAGVAADFQPVAATVTALAVILVGGLGDVALAPLGAPAHPSSSSTRQKG